MKDKQYYKDYYYKNRDKILARNKSEKRKEYRKEYYKNNKEAHKKRIQKYRTNNRETYLKNARNWANKHYDKEKLMAKGRDRKKKNPYWYWSYCTLNKHKENGYDIQIKVPELEQIARNTKTCFLCGNEFCWDADRKNKVSYGELPSLDRLNNERHISKDNIAIICHKCNTTKGARTLEEFLTYCFRVVTKNIILPNKIKEIIIEA